MSHWGESRVFEGPPLIPGVVCTLAVVGTGTIPHPKRGNQRTQNSKESMELELVRQEVRTLKSMLNQIKLKRAQTKEMLQKINSGLKQVRRGYSSVPRP
eukprot:6791116-Pyramimonas_sp.AAC.3